ncbi:hypothetical protein [Halorubrum vacuolatum]|uniref:Uncharacterized protein n=1 Tax=Halorubrum vacuolatum TaxID=63740 RepID=A0A238WJ22_HALVU|nr:hypothetical protein [Halorubrum vacuolatum]SNR46448.1 hypothetical protein SAMN06264855_10844 [Halorubrum vacuolatum]
MADDDRRGAAFSEGFVVPIAGLLSLLFALMAGITLGNAIGGAPSDYALPVTFGIVSILAFRLRQRVRAARETSEK